MRYFEKQSAVFKKMTDVLKKWVGGGNEFKALDNSINAVKAQTPMHNATIRQYSGNPKFTEMATTKRYTKKVK